MQSMLRRRHGFTLVEILIIAPFAMLLIGALIVMATQATNSSLRSYAKTRLQNDVLSALDRMSQDAQLSMHLNYTSDSDAQLKMEAIATSANPLSATRQLIAKSNCAASNAIANFSDVTTYALTYSYNSTNHQLTRTGDFTGKWCGGSQAAQGSSVWQRHNTPEILIQDANVTLVVSNYAQEDTIAQTASSAKVTLTATRVVAGEAISYTGEIYISSINTVEDVGGGPTLLADGAFMQQVTTDNCPATRIRAVDARDNRTYWVQKLSDNKCWMLTNLAYAGGTSNGGTNTYNDTIPTGNGTSGTLHGPDNSGSITYTFAKYYAHAGANPTTNPAQPSTDTTGGGTGANRQYGYLYNWCAAMGAQNGGSKPSTSACANATTPAPNTSISICPSGWRLPTGEQTTGDFTLLNNAVNGGLTTTDAGLRSEWLAQRSGYWSTGFYDQISNSRYWSSTQSSVNSGRYLYFTSSSLNPSSNGNKNLGFAVRCVAN